MPAYTPFPQPHRGEVGFWDLLTRLDDGKLNLWHGITAAGGAEIDVLLLDAAGGAWCIEVNAMDVAQIRCLDEHLIKREDGSVAPSPFDTISRAAKALGTCLDKKWETRPNLVPIVVFPNISRSDWLEKFGAGAIDGCVLNDDLGDLDSLRSRLRQIAGEDAVHGISISDVRRMHGELFGGSFLATFNGPDNPYPPELSILDEVIALIEGPGSAYASPGAEHLRRWRQELPRTRDRLRVSIVGEFKAGKSSLINAILRGDVCYVDEFEATTIGATYTDGAPEGALVEFEDGHAELWSLAVFLERCALKQTQGIEGVTMTLRTGLPFDIADSPGLGSVTEGQDARAEAEIRQTDLLLWAVDSNDAGSAREGAFIQRARKIGLPILVVLTKSDAIPPEDVDALVEYVSEETGVPAIDVIAVSALKHLAGRDDGVSELLEKLHAAAGNRTGVQQDAYRAKRQESIEGSRAILRFAVERNASHARFLNAERTYLETSAVGVAQAAKADWLRVLREECSSVANSDEIQTAVGPAEVEAALRMELPEAVERATRTFLGSLRRLVRDEWRGALEQRSLEFEKRLAELLKSRPEAEADLRFLEAERDAFRTRAAIVASESEPTSNDSRLWVMGIGAAAALLTVSLLPLAVAGVVAVLATRETRPTSTRLQIVDFVIGNKIQEALLSSFETVADSVEIAIDKLVSDVAMRSLIRLVDARGGANYQTILVIEQKANDLMDELALLERG